VINEMGNTVTAFSLQRRYRHPHFLANHLHLPRDFQQLAIAPKWWCILRQILYGSNRGHTTASPHFAIHPVKGTLTALGQTPTGGKWPRNFHIDPPRLSAGG
jgi:6-phosphogluconolactonase (cycloisomerase 2 family)